ncbi:DUF155 family [Micractinium conductrix]|uniref:DUF155 family n=1 Tax=Micractinium conductrix TaxID=554055 RepID=A0A2P6V8I4_9CHLO|nr:DUF155 family [Micractinium conductrix]|eukprot:PSC70381.1 DUF155 family [Micractinium conductrix]
MLLRSLVAGPLGPGGLAATALRASPALAQLLSGAMEAWKGAGSGQHAAAGLQRWGALTALAPPPPPPAAAGQRRGFAASTAWQQSRPTAVTQAATAAERGRGSGRDGKLSNALDGTAALSVDWPEENDASDCSMCTAGALDDEARAAVAAAEEAEAAAGTAVAGADELAWRRGRTPPQRLPVMQEQVFKADAHYVGSKIDIYALKARKEFEGHYKKVHKGAVVLSLSPRHISDQCETEGMPLDPAYMVAFNYGSVVFFNAGPKLRQRHLAIAREVAADPVSSERPYVEEYCLTLSPTLPVWSSCSPDNIKLQSLDLKNIQVISQVLAQSVAMDFYSSHVERTLETFCNMNLEMQESQNISKINKQVLLQLVAENNIVMTDIINKLGVHERFDIAWKHVNYGKIWEFLRSELEMDGRFKTLESKLNLIQDNLKYFLEILQNRKSDTLEWIIIILIGAEICLSLYDLFSKGFN